MYFHSIHTVRIKLPPPQNRKSKHRPHKITNSVTEFKVSEEIEQELDEQGYTAAGRLPRSNILVRNIANGDSWDKFMRPNQREPFARLYARVWKAFMRMLAGEFHNIWRD